VAPSDPAGTMQFVPPEPPRAGAGTCGTFRAVYDAHVRFVWRALLRLGVRESDLPDAVQDVFVVVHRKLPEFEGRSKMTTWLFAICARVASDRRQLARERHETAVGDPALREGPADDPEGTLDPAVLVDRRRARALIDAILDRMPDEQRTVFALFELEGMSGDEIAELLDVPVGTVRSRLRLARTWFEQSLTRWQARETRRLAVSLKAREA
jgi:RNA polymerase sigma-70 factor (ECF subfamily)